MNQDFKKKIGRIQLSGTFFLRRIECYLTVLARHNNNTGEIQICFSFTFQSSHWLILRTVQYLYSERLHNKVGRKVSKAQVAACNKRSIEKCVQKLQWQNLINPRETRDFEEPCMGMNRLNTFSRLFPQNKNFLNRHYRECIRNRKKIATQYRV